MKKDIHPKYYKKAKIICACGHTFIIGSSLPEIQIEICSNCHPFYTGTQKLVDTARRVDKFKKKMEKTAKIAKVRKGKKVKRAKKAELKKEKEKKIKVEAEDKK